MIINRMKKSVDAREELTIPTYTLGRKKKKGVPLKVVIPVAAVLLLAIAIYVPPALNDVPQQNQHDSVIASGNVAAMEEAITYLRNNPMEDFDGDGLSNEEESRYNTGVYIRDNDFDGTTDYAELYITESNPCVYDDAIIRYVQEQDQRSGNSVNTPFKVHDIIMWADDYAAKARGSVIEVYEDCFVFSNFSGWVQFPGDVFPYQVKDGYQTALKTNEQGYYRIESEGEDVTVHTYDAQPEECYVLSLLGSEYKLAKNALSKTLHFILPNKGFGLIVCHEATASDLDASLEEQGYCNEIIPYVPGELNSIRFGKDTNQLADLNTIIRQLDAGHNVIISLMSHTSGEAILEVYGYTSHNNLFVCNPQTGDPMGILNIGIVSRRLLDETGNINQYEYFTFSGCGYSSEARHRLAIIDYIGNQPQQPEAEEEIVEPEDPVEEPMITPEPQLERTLQEQVFDLFSEFEEVEFAKNSGRYQSVFEGVSEQDILRSVTAIKAELGFNRYYDDSYSTEGSNNIIVSDEQGNIVSIAYVVAEQRLTLRFEAFDAEQTVELKPDKFIQIESQT